MSIKIRKTKLAEEICGDSVTRSIVRIAFRTRTNRLVRIVTGFEASKFDRRGTYIGLCETCGYTVGIFESKKKDFDLRLSEAIERIHEQGEPV